MEAKIWNKNGWVNEIDPTKLKNTFSELLGLSGFDILNFQEHYFNPIGWTGLWLLGESHCAIHTFPEEKKAISNYRVAMKIIFCTSLRIAVFNIAPNVLRLGVCYFALQIFQALDKINRQNNSTKPLLVAGAVN